MLGGGHWQKTTDVNDDAWADLPGYQRAVVRPRRVLGRGKRPDVLRDDRLYLRGPQRRHAGRPGARRPRASRTSKRSRRDRYDAGAVGQFLVKGRYVVTARAAVARQSHDHQFGEVLERDRHDTAFGEVAVRGTVGPPDVGRRARDRARRLHAARCAAIRLHVHRARSIRSVRRQRNASIVALLEWPAGRPQRVRHLLQSPRVGAGARRTLDQPTLGWNRLLWADAHHRRN